MYNIYICIYCAYIRMIYKELTMLTSRMFRLSSSSVTVQLE